MTMTPVEESCTRLLAAVHEQDLATAEKAVADLSAAIAGLVAAEPASGLAQHLIALEMTQAACRSLEALKCQFNLESSRLDQVDRIFVRTLRVLPDGRIDCCG